MQLLDLFTSPVYIFEPQEALLAEHSKMLTLVHAHRTVESGVIRSNYGNSWHSTDNTLSHTEAFRPVMSHILGRVSEACTHQGYEGARLILNNAWVTVSDKGAGNVRHNHPRSTISGVYYIAAPVGSTTLSVHDPRAVKTFTQPVTPPDRTGPYLSSSYNIAAIEGRLVLFPSWLEHSVPAHEGDDPRVVLSFNFLLT